MMPSRLVPMAITSKVKPQNTWKGRYRTRNHDDTTGNRKNNRPRTHWEEEEELSKAWFTLDAKLRRLLFGSHVNWCSGSHQMRSASQTARGGVERLFWRLLYCQNSAFQNKIPYGIKEVPAYVANLQRITFEGLPV